MSPVGGYSSVHTTVWAMRPRSSIGVLLQQPKLFAASVSQGRMMHGCPLHRSRVQLGHGAQSKSIVWEDCTWISPVAEADQALAPTVIVRPSCVIRVVLVGEPQVGGKADAIVRIEVSGGTVDHARVVKYNIAWEINVSGAGSQNIGRLARFVVTDQPATLMTRCELGRVRCQSSLLCHLNPCGQPT